MRRCMSQKPLPQTALRYVLESLIPYTDANLKLAFSPNLFFNDLENIAKQKQRTTEKVYKKQTIRNAYYRAKRESLITFDQQSRPQLSATARYLLEPYHPIKLGDGSYILVTFDIPEKRRHDRNHFRGLLLQLNFTKVQKSVWKSQYDCKAILEVEIDYHHLHQYVHIYEALRIA